MKVSANIPYRSVLEQLVVSVSCSPQVQSQRKVAMRSVVHLDLPTIAVGPEAVPQWSIEVTERVDRKPVGVNPRLDSHVLQSEIRIIQTQWIDDEGTCLQ